jgi:hypothetical protein
MEIQITEYIEQYRRITYLEERMRITLLSNLSKTCTDCNWQKDCWKNQLRKMALVIIEDRVVCANHSSLTT